MSVRSFAKMEFQGTLLVFSLFCTMVATMAVNAPTCAVNCWENSKYVTDCQHELQCLCEDSEFQNSVFQCLYSQCPPVHFGAALHHILSECSDYPTVGIDDVPPLIRHHELRKRAQQDKPLASVKLPLSANAAFTSAQAVHSVRRRYLSASVVPNVARPVRSAINNVARTSQRALATKSPLPTGLDDVGFNESLAPSRRSGSNILPSATAPASLVTSTGPGAVESHGRIAEAQPSATISKSGPYNSGKRGLILSTNTTSLITMPTATSLITGGLGGYNFTTFNNASITGTVLPRINPSGTNAVRFNGTQTYKRQPRAHWSLF